MGWTTQSHRPSTHLGFTTATSERLDSPIVRLDVFSLVCLDDPWSSESNGRNSATMVGHDPWQTVAPSSDPTANPWDENHSSTTNGASLSINMADPWGTGNPNSTRATTSTSPPSKTVHNELSEFFGASASKCCWSGSLTAVLFQLFPLRTSRPPPALPILGTCHCCLPARLRRVK